MKFKKARPGTLGMIRRAVQACRKKRIPIAESTWGTVFDEGLGYFVPDVDEDGSRGVCALGALLVYKNGDLKYEPSRGRRGLDKTIPDDMAAYVLGVDEEWVQNFTHGFDGGDVVLDNSDFYGMDDEGRLFDVENEVMSVRKLSASDRERLRAFFMGRKLRAEFIEGKRDNKKKKKKKNKSKKKKNKAVEVRR